MLTLLTTPIGNLEDVSERLVRILREADTLFAEDTRQSRKLLNHLGIERRIESYHDHSGPGAQKRIAGCLQRGEHVAYMTDAGTPGISDPGYELVNLALSLGSDIDAVPGPSAVINALVLAGLPSHEFAFLGFFPITKERRRALTRRLTQLTMTTVFFEGPSRIRKTLAFLAESLPQSEIAVCREMTKIHQQILRGKPAQVLADLVTVKGEFVLVIGPITEAPVEQDLTERMASLRAAGLSPTQCAKTLAQEFGLPKREIYSRMNQTLEKEGKKKKL